MLGLYSEGIVKLNQNPNLPQLFRDIFKNAYLPYRDPETLKLFLKTINEFTYDHSERLGDAFEYLLSVLGSQGDAGQFRTPRHIIDFMVKVVNPQKNETILDPACGTAGFLISSFKHILKENTKKRPGDLLTPDERKKLLTNFKGYDISPDMVRLSLVNLYLHGFVQPQIIEYDTLTSEDRWNEYADVIFANPPFMSPKGGIKPHKKFSVQSNRSEVLFVDYIAEHLTPTGRAAVIVPEGIIFQSAGAYKQLRKMLIENHLYAVVSLPAGIFNPYSGVKTSVLLMDRQIAKRCDSILFIKIENDGFGLGAQRREQTGSDLPDAVNVITDYVKAVRSGILPLGRDYSPYHSDEQSENKGKISRSARNDNENARNDSDSLMLTNSSPVISRSETTRNLPPSLKTAVENGSALLVSKEKLAENGEYNLTGDRYRISIRKGHQKWPMVKLGDEAYFRVESGGTPDSSNETYWNGNIFWSTLVDLPANDHISIIYDTVRKITEKGLKNSSAKIIPVDSIIVSTRATIGRVAINKVPLSTNQGFKNIVIEDKTRILPVFLAHMVKQLIPKMVNLASGGTFKEISKTNFCSLQIPLPPLEIQREIVDEIEGYQKIIDGARQVVESWKPRIEINSEWPIKPLGDIITLQRGYDLPKVQFINGDVPVIGSNGIIGFHNEKKEKGPGVVTGRSGTIGKVHFIDYEYYWPHNTALFVKEFNGNNRRFIKYLLESIDLKSLGDNVAAVPSLDRKNAHRINISLPPLEIQHEIVTKIEAERKVVEGCRELIKTYEDKIKQVIDKVWEE